MAGPGPAFSTAQEHDEVRYLATRIEQLSTHRRQELFDRLLSTPEPAAPREGRGGEQAKTPAPAYEHTAQGSLGLSLETVDDAFRYQPWNSAQQSAGDQVREALAMAARTILRVVPAAPSRVRALAAVMDARMLANQGISFQGRL
jgi:hypothetical protein